MGLLGHLRNRYLAFAFISTMLVGSYYMQPLLWKYIFSALITYLAATLVMRYSLSKGVFQLRRYGRNVVTEGHAFVVFIFIIISATLFSNVLASYIEHIALMDVTARPVIILMQTVAILGLLLIDMKFEF